MHDQTFSIKIARDTLASLHSWVSPVVPENRQTAASGEIQIKLPGYLHRENGVICSRVDQRHKLRGCGEPVAQNDIKVGAWRSIRERPGVVETHAAYFTPATSPSSANGPV